MTGRRTDLALEAKELYEESAGRQTALSGVEATERAEGEARITTVRVLSGEGAAAIGKPEGTYITIETGEDDADTKTAEILARELRALLDCRDDCFVLVAGLGNAAVTPDAVGPLAVRGTLVTRHLREQLPEIFGDMRPVSALETGVLGTTGMESSAIVGAVAGKTRPERVIAVDALASRSLSRVCRTIQLSDTGIVPGSGVGNSRGALNESTLGVPVIAIGVPTVVDAATLCADMLEEAGLAGYSDEARELLGAQSSMIVTPKDIDARVKAMANTVSMGINMALHETLSRSDIEWMLRKC